jgi:Transposase DDE domain
MDRVRGQTKLQGLRFFRPICGLLGELRKHCPHHNRTLHFDEYLVLLLLSFYNPSLKSLRGLVKCSDTPLAERNLGLHHTSLGSLSEASQVFDPGLLRHMFIELAGQALAADATPRPKGFPADLKILAADATLWRLLPRMARDLYVKPLTRARKGALKGHFIFNVLRGIPEDVEWTGGAVDERSVLPGQLARGALYVVDRGYNSKAMFNTLIKAGASFVMRLAKTYTYETIEDRPIGSAGEKAGVYSDALVKFTGVEPALRVVRARRVAPPSRNLHPLRKGGKHASPARGEPLVQDWILITDRLDMPADQIVELYAYRWQIETFFRWFKVTLDCKHLLCESENGFALQMYAALIATLLVVIHTGRKPNKGLLLAIHLYLMGWNEWAQVEKEIARCAPGK